MVILRFDFSLFFPTDDLIGNKEDLEYNFVVYLIDIGIFQLREFWEPHEYK